MAVAFAQTRPRVRARAGDGGGETEHEPALVEVELAHERDVAVEGVAVLPRHAPVAEEILPTVGSPDIACARSRKAAVAGETERGRTSPSRQVIPGAGVVVLPAVAEMRRKQWVKLHVLAAEPVRDQNRVADRVRHDFEVEFVTVPLVRDLRQRHPALRHGERIAVGALYLEPARWPRDNEAKIAHLRLAGRWPVDLVDDAEAHGDPDA